MVTLAPLADRLSHRYSDCDEDSSCEHSAKSQATTSSASFTPLKVAEVRPAPRRDYEVREHR